MENTRELKEERLQRPQADTLRMELQVGRQATDNPVKLSRP